MRFILMLILAICGIMYINNMMHKVETKVETIDQHQNQELKALINDLD